MLSNSKLINIYILKLENNKYYIGKSKKFENRIEKHFNGFASSWTKKYKPISIEKIIPNVSIFDEDRYTKEYMAKYGIDNVRGGSYVKIELDDDQIDMISNEIRMAQNLCVRCGRNNHFIKNCYAKIDISGNKIEEEYEWLCDYCNKIFTSEICCNNHEQKCSKRKSNIICYRCGKTGHYSTDCYAKIDISGNKIEEEYECICKYCDRVFTSDVCYEVHKQICNKRKSKIICYRCGRIGHYSTDCYATQHINEYYLD